MSQQRSKWSRPSGRRPKPKATEDEVDDTSERHNDNGITHQGIWALFARVKYWTAKHRGPRTKPDVPDEAQLRAIAERLRDVLDDTWRAGFKGEDLSRMLYAITKDC